MSRKLVSHFILLMALGMSVPRMAHAYVDPGTGAMVWQVAAAACIGCLFYVKRAASWLRTRFGTRSQRAMGFVFASCFALMATPFTLFLFHANPLPRFNDIFLVGIVLTAYMFTWEGSGFLLLISLVVSAWVLPPNDSLRISTFADWYRLISFALVSVFLIGLITRLKAQRPAPAPAVEERSYSMRGVAAGAD